MSVNCLMNAVHWPAGFFLSQTIQLREIAGLDAEAEVLSAAPAALDTDVDRFASQQAEQKYGHVFFTPEHYEAALSGAGELPGPAALTYLYAEFAAAKEHAPEYASDSERGAQAVEFKVGVQQVPALDLKTTVVYDVKLPVGGLGRTRHGLPDGRPAAAAGQQQNQQQPDSGEHYCSLTTGR